MNIPTLVIGVGGGIRSDPLDGHGYLWRAHPDLPIIETEDRKVILRAPNYPRVRHRKERNLLIEIFIEEKSAGQLILHLAVQLFSLEQFPYLIRKEVYE